MMDCTTGIVVCQGSPKKKGRGPAALQSHVTAEDDMHRKTTEPGWLFLLGRGLAGSVAEDAWPSPPPITVLAQSDRWKLTKAPRGARSTPC